MFLVRGMIVRTTMALRTDNAHRNMDGGQFLAHEIDMADLAVRVVSSWVVLGRGGGPAGGAVK